MPQTQQLQFGKSGDLVEHKAKRFCVDTESQLLHVLFNWNIYTVDEQDAVASEKWGVMNASKDILIIPKSEAAKRFLARFWDGHQEDIIPSRGRPPFYEPSKLMAIAEFFSNLDDIPSIKTDKHTNTIVFWNKDFTIHLLPQDRPKEKGA
jgi:hypothetical protein